ncbi:MAG: beta-lactamase family protein [Candidatus Saccharimonas sp.]|nr:beta-lactamase family protein [Planctomycetaceae bacterium]
MSRDLHTRLFGFKMREAKMNRTSESFLTVTLLWFSLSSASVLAEIRPMSGKTVPGFEPIDQAVLEFLDKIGCQAATVAVSRDAQTLYSRGYGWSDQARRNFTPPDALMRIASVTKPITAAAVKNAIRAQQLSHDTKAFELIAVKVSGGKVADPKFNSITVGQLLEHKGGWDEGASFDPMFRTKRIEQELRLRHPAKPEDVIKYMLGQSLQFTPGEKTVYSNFGFCVLGRVLEKATKKPYANCVQQTVCKPLGIKDIKLGYSALKKRDKREVWYPVAEDAFSLEVLDSLGGLIASAPALCQFMDAYWINGDPRLQGQRGDWIFFGSLPGTTALVRQRDDGVNIAVLLNGRRDKHFKEDDPLLKKAIDLAIENVNLVK